jgi:nitroreductase
VELADALRRRRACRDFLPEPLPEELVARLVQAANRAPTASNVPYREVLVVDDPRVIRAVRQISPALMADPPQLLVILTDLRLAVERVGPVGEASSLIDAGAAGENVWLAATDLGLGTQFTMISAMPGIRVILGLPEHVRVDLIMPIGYPAPRAAASTVRSSVRPARVHRNQYGDVDEPA